MEPLVRIQDNPILIAQAQRRLRRGQIVPMLLIAGMLSACGVLWSLARGGDAGDFRGLAFAALFAIGFALYLRAPTQIATSLREERTSGILDFHRATPLTPWTQAMGYALGCGAREYVLAAVFALVFVPAAILGKLSPLSTLLALGYLALAGLLYGTYAMWIGLSLSNKRGVSGAVVGTLIVLLSFGWTARSVGAVAFFTPYPALVRLLEIDSARELGSDVLFYGLSIHPALFTLVVQGSVLLFFVWASARKLRQEGAPSFSRSGALLLLAWILFLTVGGAWRWLIGDGTESSRGVITAALISFVLLGTGLASSLLISLTPSYLSFVRGLRRARRRGLPAADWLSDEGSPWPLAAIFAAQVLVGLAVLWLAMRGRLQPRDGLVQTAMLVGIAVPAFLLFVCSAAEYTRIVRRGAVRSVGALIAFVTLVLPWMLGGIFEAGLGKGATLYVFALSPGFGVFGAAGLFASASASGPTEDLALPPVVLSLATSLALSAWFFLSTRSVREGLSAKVALGTGKPTP
ncbi:MAG: hypothetical protein U1A78_03550 [Polyangia bacterium]